MQTSKTDRKVRQTGRKLGRAYKQIRQAGTFDRMKGKYGRYTDKEIKGR